MNAALAFAGAGNEAGKNELAAGIRELGEDGRTTAVEVGLPLVEGAWAFAREDYDGAIRSMAPAIGRIEGVGGSNAQHEVFWDALIEAYLRTDRFAEAEDLQTSRLDPRATVRDLFRLGRAQIGGGKPEDGMVNLRRAAEGWRKRGSRLARGRGDRRVAGTLGAGRGRLRRRFIGRRARNRRCRSPARTSRKTPPPRKARPRG